MPIQSTGADGRRFPAAALVAAFALLAPAAAYAQQPFGSLTPARSAVGERYHVELSGTLWNPSLAGTISSEQFDIVGSDIDLVNDLGFQQTRFNGFSLVLRPAKKHRFRLEDIPIAYTSRTTFSRDIIYNGQRYSVNIPVDAAFGWKVWRLGYEYDFLYEPRGFIGVLAEARYTRFTSSLTAAQLGLSEYANASGPLPAVGLVGRAYVLPDVALNVEVTGFRLPNVNTKYQAHYFDWNLYGTVNVNDYVGVQAGWRRITTFIKIKEDMGDLKFQGMWFGGVVRY